MGGDDYRRERDLSVRADINHFLECLGLDRKTHFSIISYPDAENRNEPSPDCLARDDFKDCHLVVEHTELRKNEDMPRLRYQADKFGGAFVPTLLGEDLAVKLVKAIEHKKEKAQSVSYPSAEKALLMRDWVSFAHRTQDITECNEYFKPPKDSGYDHCYVILRSCGEIIELF
ncbi:hypothetical protein ACFLYV_02630 [Chloroflexota bacterium]